MIFLVEHRSSPEGATIGVSVLVQGKAVVEIVYQTLAVAVYPWGKTAVIVSLYSP